MPVFRCRSLSCALALCGGVLAVSGGTAGAATVSGVAVDAIGSDTRVGTTEARAALGGAEAIRYFIPLGGSHCIFGVGGCGMSADTGDGGPVMTMILRFDPVSTSNRSMLTINFEDLDLDGVNDPARFLETVEVFDSDDISLTDKITDIDNALVTGGSDTQQMLSFGLGTLDESPLFLKLGFTADSDFYGRNTVEFLTASVAAVPLPAAGWLMIAGLGGLAGLRRRRRAA